MAGTTGCTARARKSSRRQRDASSRDAVGEPGPEGEKALAGEEKPAGFDFQYTIDSMESSVLPAMRSQMTEQFGKAFGMEVDWDSLEGDPDHVALAVSSVLGTVMGALMTLVNDRAAKGPLVAAVGALRVRYDARVRGAVPSWRTAF